MGLLRRLVDKVRNPTKSASTDTFAIVPSPDGSTDLCIEHVSGVVIRIEHDGSVIVSTPSNLALHAEGNLEITSNTHIGLVAPRIDLN